MARKDDERAPKRNINLNLDGDLATWVAFAAALDGVSQTRYINDVIRRDRDTCLGKRGDADTAEAYRAFAAAREKREG